MRPEGSRAVSTDLSLTAGSLGQGSFIPGPPFPNRLKIESWDRSFLWIFEMMEVFLILDLSAKVKLSLHRFVEYDDEFCLLPVVL